jgi:uncharacterized membrane protein
MRRTVGIWWLVLTAVAIAVLAPLPYVTSSLRSLAADDAELALNYVNRPTWVKTVFYAHIAGGGVALLLSVVQLSARVRARVPRLHRVSGRLVLVGILVGGTAGLVLAPFNLAGPIGVPGFGSLAVLWLTFAILGFRAIRRGDVTVHRQWMLRTFALTYAAVTLRLWLAVLVPLTGEFHTAYVIVPFLAWVPNLVVVELLIRSVRRSESRYALG